jgi:gluconolactonase
MEHPVPDNLPPVGGTIHPAVRVLDARLAALIDPGAPLVRLAEGCIWSEGPVWMPREQALQWSDIPNDRALRWSEAAGVHVVRQPNDFTNGNTLDREGRVIHCEHGNRRVARTEADGTRVGLVDRYGEGRLNSPNDVVVAKDGAIWFTDPPYGIIFPEEGHPSPMEQAGCYVYRFDPGTDELALVADGVRHPNGLAFSPDESILYVADTYWAVDKTADRPIFAFDVVDGRRLVNQRVFAQIDPGPADGFRVDVHGNVWTSAHDGIHILGPDGHELGRILVPEITSNCVFGGPDGRRLFITASSSLYAIDVLVTGAGVAAAVARGEFIA